MSTRRATLDDDSDMPKPSDVNPFAVERKAAMMRAKITAVDVHELVKEKVSVATVQKVISGNFRNDDVIAAFTKLTGLARSVMFPATELEWISQHREAVQRVIEAAR